MARTRNKYQAYGRDISNSRYRYTPPPRPYRRVPRNQPLRLSFSLTPIADKLVYGDRRLFYPDPLHRPAFSFIKNAARVQAVQNPRKRQLSQTKAVLAFAKPSKVMLCVRRESRRQVLHAKGVAGSRGLRRPRFNEFSEISCRRT